MNHGRRGILRSPAACLEIRQSNRPQRRGLKVKRSVTPSPCLRDLRLINTTHIDIDRPTAHYDCIAREYMARVPPDPLSIVVLIQGLRRFDPEHAM